MYFGMGKGVADFRAKKLAQCKYLICKILVLCDKADA